MFFSLLFSDREEEGERKQRRFLLLRVESGDLIAYAFVEQKDGHCCDQGSTLDSIVLPLSATLDAFGPNCTAIQEQVIEYDKT